MLQKCSVGCEQEGFSRQGEAEQRTTVNVNVNQQCDVSMLNYSVMFQCQPTV